MIAITDHDGVDGIMEAEIAGEALQIKVIRASSSARITTWTAESWRLHILGYHIDTADKALTDALCSIRAQRKARNGSCWRT